MVLNPAGLARIRRQKRQPHQPKLSRPPEITFGLEFFCFGCHSIQLLGVHESMALSAYKIYGHEVAGAAAAGANQFRSNGGHGESEFYRC